MSSTYGPDSTITDPTFSSPFSVTSLHSAENSALQPWKFSNSNSTTWTRKVDIYQHGNSAVRRQADCLSAHQDTLTQVSDQYVDRVVVWLSPGVCMCDRVPVSQ